MEFMVPEHIFDAICKGMVISCEVVSKKKSEDGFIIESDGIIFSNDGITEDATLTDVETVTVASPVKEERAIEEVGVVSAEPEDGLIDLSGAAPESELQSPKSESDQAKPKLSFGKRGPQFAGMEDPDSQIPDEPEENVNLERRIISSTKELVEFLNGIDPSDPKYAEPEEPVDRDTAVQMDAQLSGGIGADIYIKNVSSGQLVLSDIDVRIRYGDVHNMSRVSPIKLKNSSDLFEAINCKLIEFVNPEEAKKINLSNSKRLAKKEAEINGIEVYDSADDVLDEIEDSYDDHDERFAEHDFRRGITSKSTSRRRRQSRNYYDEHDDYIDDLVDASVNQVPGRLQNVTPYDILKDMSNSAAGESLGEYGFAEQSRPTAGRTNSSGRRAISRRD